MHRIRCRVVCGRICRARLTKRSAPAVLAGCHRRRRKSEKESRISRGIRAQREVWLALGPASPGSCVMAGKTAAIQDGQSGAARVSAEAGRLHSRVHPDAEKAELGSAQSGARALDEWNRSYDVYPRRRPQPAGALDCAHTRRPRKRSSRRALSRDPRDAGCRGRSQSHARAFEVWSETAEEGVGEQWSVAGGQLPGSISSS